MQFLKFLGAQTSVVEGTKCHLMQGLQILTLFFKEVVITFTLQRKISAVL